MGTEMGSAGVRIRVKDNSAYSIVENPNAIAGVVGFATKGELNKILTLKNTADQNMQIGYGYQNSKHNQGMYAARAVLNAGGYVEFVRPYGETIDKSDPYKRDLKTDCFVVAYDKNAARYDEFGAASAPTSLNIKHFASTRYKTDGAAAFGVTRKINNISETISEGSNVNFVVDAGSEFADSSACRPYDPSKRLTPTDMVLFAILASDPSSANRAYDRYDITKTRYTSGKTFTCTLSTFPALNVGDEVYLPMTNGGSTNKFATATVTGVSEYDVTMEISDRDNDYFLTGNEPNTLLFCDRENAIGDGCDYLTVKTAVAGRGVKTFTTMHYGAEQPYNSSLIPNGTLVEFFDSYKNPFAVRFENSNKKGYTTLADKKAIEKTSAPNTFNFTFKRADSICVGDTLTLEISYEGTTANFPQRQVTISAAAVSIKEEKISGTVSNDDAEILTSFIVAVGGDWSNVDSELTIDLNNSAEGSFKVNITSATSWTDVANALYATLEDDSIGYTKNLVANDVELDGDGKPRFVDNVVYVAPSAALEYSIGDTVVIVRGKNQFNTTGLNSSDEVANTILTVDPKNTYYTSKIVGINAMSGAITLDASTLDNTGKITDLPTVAYTYSVDENGKRIVGNDYKVYFNYQLIDTTASAMTTYNAVTSESWVTPHVKTINKKSDLGLDTVPDSTAMVYTTLNVGNLELSDDQFVANDVVTLTYFLVESNPDPEGSPYILVRDADNNPLKQTLTFTVDTVKDGILHGHSNQVGLARSPEWSVFPTEGTIPGKYEGLSDEEKAEVGSEYYVISCDKSYTRDWVDEYIISSYTMYVASVDQDAAQCLITESGSAFAKNVIVTRGAKKSSGEETAIVEKSAKVLADAGIGATFMGLGLASTGYADVNFNGDPIQTYILNDDGEAIARMYVSVKYSFGGTVYEFSGTIVPYLHNDTQLYIGDSAEVELYNSGLRFVTNMSGVLDNFLENNSYDLSQTVANGILNGNATAISFNPEDPAIVNDAVWSYIPSNNNSGNTLSTAWNLFLDKDGSDVSFLVASGTAVNNLFMGKLETLNTQVMEAMLTVCQLRKDCFALFDGVADAKVATTIKKNQPATTFSSELGRWGAIYDGRGIFKDSVYTKSNVEIVRSVQMAALVTANRSGGIWWKPPAGKTYGRVPGSWESKELYPRRYSYPEDPKSDIALLSNIHCNPVRCASDGYFFWGDFTMQMEDTAFNQIHVAMLMAGVHKAFYKYLDDKVFRLNTANLRKQITSDLQAQLDTIKLSNPSGFYDAYVVCDETNNTPEIIDQNKLMVDLKVKPTKTSRYIILTSEVLSTSDGNQVTTTLS